MVSAPARFGKLAKQPVTQKEWISERVVEVPWVLRHLKKGQRTVDVGCAENAYLGRLFRRVGFLYGIVTRPCPFRHRRFRFRWANIARRTPFRSGFFKQIVCISTLKHIGLKAYGNPPFPQGDLHALRQMYRLLAPDGRLLLTIPFGQREFHGWFKVYDSKQWDRLLNKTQFKIREEACFKYVRSQVHYWPCRRQDLQSVGYGKNRAHGVLCTVLVKERT